MAGPRRPRSRIPAPAVSNDDDITLPDTPADGSPATDNGDASSQHTISPAVRDSVSGLSEHRETLGGASHEVDPLSRIVKFAIATMGKLEMLGLQKFNIATPRCIVLGQQSSGKSSVIEAISGIKTPRDTGTCTSCPLYITMNPSDDPKAGWSARVSLQINYEADVKPRHGGNLTRQQFPRWTPAESSRQIFFAETKSRAELEQIIRCAQSANLSPLEDVTDFLGNPEPREGSHRIKFSPNLVCIDITEPGLASLSFFDLPGIISQAETEEEAYTVPLVQNLVAEYIKMDKTLILVTCDLGTDIANSSAAALARQYGATDRCIGVLTKPDLLPPGTPDAILADVLDGKRFKLGHKYFVVKNLNKEEITLGLGHREARIKEQEFFASASDRWATTLKDFAPRFGTLNLQSYLSKELARQILHDLPAIREQITSRLHDVEAELEGIPVTPGHSAQRTVADLVLKFTTNVSNEMQGEYGYTYWINSWEAIQKEFYDALLAMKPTLVPRGALDKGIYASSVLGQSVDQSIMIDSGDEDEDGNETQKIPETPTKKRKLDGETPAPSPSPFKTPKKPVRRPTPQGSGSQASSGSATFAKYRKRFLLDELASDINHASKNKVPGHVHPKFRDEMMLSVLQYFKLAVNLFFKSLETALTTRIDSMFTEAFKDWQGADVCRKSLVIVHELLQNNLNEQMTTMAEETLNDELEGPRIFHKDHFDQERTRIRDHYGQSRSSARLKIYVEECERHSGKELSAVEQDKISKDKHKMDLMAREPYAREIDLIAEVTSYYNIASRRLHDSICMRVESKFFKQLRTQLREELENGLGIYDQDGPQTAQALLEESPERERRRQELLMKRDALVKGLDCLNELSMKLHGNSNVGHMANVGFDASVVMPPVDQMEGITKTGIPIS